MGTPANNNLTSRLCDLMNIRQGSNQNFNNLCDNDGEFCDLIQLLQNLVQKNGGPFTGMVTPDNTPGRSAGGAGGGNASRGSPAVAGSRCGQPGPQTILSARAEAEAALGNCQ